MRRRGFLAAVCTLSATGCMGGDGGSEGVVWTNAVGGDVDIVEDDVVYGREYWGNEGGNGGVFALDEEDGGEIWTYGESAGASRYTRCVLGEEGVYFGKGDDVVGSGRGDLYAVGFDGEERWRRSVGSVYGAPVVTRGFVYVGSDAGSVHAFDEGGGELWRFEPPNEGRPYAPSVDAVEEGVVYVTAAGGMYALDTADGEVLWEYGKGRVSEARVARGTAYVSASVGIAAVDGDGELWRRDVGSPNPNLRGVGHGNLYFGQRRELHAVDASDGDTVWSSEIGEDYTVALGEGTVYAGDQDLGAFSPTGETEWTVELDGTEIDGLTVAEEGVYAVTEGAVYLVEGGEVVGSTEVPSAGVLSHAVSNGAVYVGSQEAVYALGV